MGVNMVLSSSFFFLLQLMSLYMVLMAENWIMIFLGMELSVMSFIPLMNYSFSKNFTVKFFMMNVFGSVLLLMGQLKVSSFFFCFGVFMKLSSFPMFWLPKSLDSKMSCWIYFWMFSFQKIPLYILWKEFFLMKDSFFFMSSCMSLILGSVYMGLSNSLMEMMSWNKVVHSMVNLLLLSFVEMNLFLMCYVTYMLTLFLVFFLISKNKMNIKTSVNSFMFILSFVGLPLFMKVMSELMLFVALKNFWGFFVIFSVVIQISVMVQKIFLIFEFSLMKNMKMNLFLYFLLLISVIIMMIF